MALEHLEDRSTPAAIAWDGGAGNLNWFSAANWTGDVLPTLTDDVTITGATGAVQIADTFGVAQANTLVSNSDIQLVTGQLQIATSGVVNGDFTLGGGTFDGVVTGAGTLTLNGDVAWFASGVMAGTGKTILNGTSTLTGSTFGSLRETRVVENAGTATMTAGSLVFRDNPTLRNLAGGTLTFANGTGIGSFFAGASSKLVNEGTLNFAGPSASTIVVATENSGTIDADAPLTLAALTNSGTIDAASALTAGVTTNSGTIDAVGNLNLSGLTNTATGTIEAGGTFSPGAVVNNGAITAIGAATLASLNNTGTFTSSATLAVNGIATNSGTVTAAGAMNTGALTNSGTIDANNNLTSAGLTNNAGGIVDVAGTFSPGAVTNAGTVIATGAATLASLNNTNAFTSANALTVNGAVTNSGVVTAGGALTAGATTNSGTIDANSTASFASVANTGLMDLSGATASIAGGSNATAIQLGAATTLTTGTLTLFPGSTIDGGVVVVSTFNQLISNGAVSVDAVRLTGGSVNASDGSAFTIGTLEQNGTVTGLGTVTVTDRWAFTNGTLNGGGRFVTAGLSTLSGGFFATIGSRIVENAGTALVDANQSFTFTAGANWTNLAGSVFEVRGNSTASTFFVNAADKFTNRGTILKTGTGTGTIALPVVNEAGGTVQVTGGILSLTAGATSAGNFDIATGAALRLTGTSALQAGATSTGAGEVQLAGNLGVTGAATLNTLKVESGTVTASAPLSVTNLNLTGTMTANAPVSVTNLNLNGTLAGTSPVTVTNFTLVNGTVNTALNVGDWTFASGTLSGTGNVTVGGTFNLTGGTVARRAISGRHLVERWR